MEPTNQNERQPFASVADFKVACQQDKKHFPETAGRLVSILIKQGHGAILADIIKNLSPVTGRPPCVRPNNSREVERMTRNLSKLRIDGGIL